MITKTLKFNRGYTRTYGNNIWHSNEGYQIARGGSSYWGWTEYEVQFKSERIGACAAFSDAKKIAQKHFDNQ